MDKGNLVNDFSRLGVVDEGAWSLDVQSNEDYTLCPSYPSVFARPAEASEDLVRAVAKYRSQGRLPCLVWRDPAEVGGVLCRAAQPRAGLLSRSSAADQSWFALIRRAAGAQQGQREVVLLDARSPVAAHANKFRGGGVEVPSRYGVQTLMYCHIRNVHHVRRVVVAIRRTQGSPLLQHKKRHAKLMRHWLQLQSLLLAGAAAAALLVRGGAAVVLHCSDGWDRTPQLSSLCLLLIDATYRTRRGFLLLVEREWLLMGHRFQLRYALGQPIFVQFLDAVYQLLHQRPEAFEFNDLFLADLAAIHDGSPPHGQATPLGTRAPFDADCDAQRAADSTGVAWDFLLDEDRASVYHNAKYAPGATDESAAAGSGAQRTSIMSPIDVDTHSFALRVWEPLRRMTAHALPPPATTGGVPCGCWPSARGELAGMEVVAGAPDPDRGIELLVTPSAVHRVHS